jgi:phosphotriesterase-related protein
MEQGRRAFLGGAVAYGAAAAFLEGARGATPDEVATVLGPVPTSALGVTLVHEHVLVDFVGAAAVSPDRYDADEAFRVALPHLQQLSRRGCRTLVECTPAYIGRDVALLRRLSEASGLHLVTNTGYYGAADDKFVPAHAFEESADALSARWIAEHAEGIEDSGVHPGLLKTGVDAGPLSEIDGKLVRAAARCHLRTGLSVAVHTGDGTAAMGVIDTLRSEGVSPRAYVWVHAQNEPDPELHVRAARAGAWVELDGVSESALDRHVETVTGLIRRGHLSSLLISQDAGWYHVGEEGGGRFRGYTYLFDTFLPALRRAGVSEAEIQALLVQNPARALRREVRRDA